MTNLALPQSEQLDYIQTLFTRFAESEASNARQVKYLQMRYMGFTRDEARQQVGVGQQTISIWRRNDDFAKLDDQSVASFKEVRDNILEFRWFRNMYLVMERDEYILRKANGMLDEEYVDLDNQGRAVEMRGSPPMSKEDWEYFYKMRAMYTPQQWSVIQKQFAEPGTQFNIMNILGGGPVQVNNG